LTSTRFSLILQPCAHPPLTSSHGQEYSAGVMKQLLTLAVLASVLSIAVFGFAAMAHGEGHSHECLGATAAGEPCPTEGNALPFATFHLNILRSFSTGVFDGTASAAALSLLSVFAILLFAAVFLDLSPPPELSFVSTFRPLRREDFVSPSTRRVSRWLSLHENSPSDS